MPTPHPTPPTHPTADLRDIVLLVMDVDGVLTDGTININDDGTETKKFHVRDGFGIALWHRMGFRSAIITGRVGRALEHRAAELGIHHIIQGARDKSAALRVLAERTGVPEERMAYIGDDWPDLGPMSRVGFAVAVADAEEPVLQVADLVTTRPGGRGAVREAIEHLLAGMGRLEDALREHGQEPVRTASPRP